MIVGLGLKEKSTQFVSRVPTKRKRRNAAWRLKLDCMEKNPKLLTISFRLRTFIDSLHWLFLFHWLQMILKRAKSVKRNDYDVIARDWTDVHLDSKISAGRWRYLGVGHFCSGLQRLHFYKYSNKFSQSILSSFFVTRSPTRGRLVTVQVQQIQSKCETKASTEFLDLDNKLPRWVREMNFPSDFRKGSVTFVGAWGSVQERLFASIAWSLLSIKLP